MLALTTILGMVAAHFAYGQSGGYEHVDPLSASKILPSEILTGSSYRIEDPVTMDGLFYSFNVRSRYGWYNPQSYDMLRIRLAEIQALDTLTAMQQDPLFLEGMSGQVKGTVQSTANAVTHPFQTIADIPLGLGKFGKQVGAKVEEGGTRPDEGIRGIHEEAKRKLAVSLGVDPYTDNQQLQDALNKVATNTNRGALVTRVGTAFIPAVGPALGAAQLNKGLQSRLANLTSAELQQETRGMLTSLGVPAGEVERFLTNPGYTPTQRAAIAEAMGDLQSVAGIQDTIRLIQIVPAPEVAHFYQRRLQMAVHFHQNVRPLEKMLGAGPSPVFVDREGTAVVTVPVDFLYWTEEVDERVRNVTGKIDGRKCELYLTSSASDLAERNLAAAGVAVFENLGRK